MMKNKTVEEFSIVWYNDLIQGRRRPNSHKYCKCRVFMVKNIAMWITPGGQKRGRVK